MRVWAPNVKQVHVRLTADGTQIELERDDFSGWHTSREADAALTAGTDYQLVLDGGEAIPDPLGRWLPQGVEGPSRAWDPAAYEWQAADWRGRSIADAGCLYELHIGTFTDEGTLDSAASKLDYLADLGVSHIELMPLSAFDGNRGWGYDGVALRAVHDVYGGPEALCRFVDAAHLRGLAVVIDVVHNHFGPCGNHWRKLGPITTDRVATPWGAAINMDGPGSDAVREILIDSVMNWAVDFRVDGLRLDAVHELVDNRAITFLEELGQSVRAYEAESGRVIELIAESDRSDPRTVTAVDRGGIGMTAQWNDDIHHVLHWLLTGENAGYYFDYANQDALKHTLERGLWFDGRYSSWRERSHGRPFRPDEHDPWRLVVALQTHDQVGNRGAGERLSQLADPNRLAAGAGLLLSLPYTPLLFMGEEWGASTPWQFFSSFNDPELGTAVTEGRLKKFNRHGWRKHGIPDSQAESTFIASKLDWQESVSTPHAELFGWYRDLLALRREHPSLAGACAIEGATSCGEISCELSGSDDMGRPDTVVLRRGNWTTAVNLSADPAEIRLPFAANTQIAAAWPAPGAITITNGTAVLSPGASTVLHS